MPVLSPLRGSPHPEKPVPARPVARPTAPRRPLRRRAAWQHRRLVEEARRLFPGCRVVEHRPASPEAGGSG